jgi:uncharacterized membrane protein
MIGLKLAGWVGAIVLVIGAGLGIKFAYDRGFFAGVSPAVWLSLLWMGAMALIGAGEYVYRRISHISATGLFGAGVASLFLVSYAGHGYYGLYQQQTAFVLMALSTLVGAAVAIRGRLVSIAVLSLIGGFLAPLVLHGDQTLVVPFLSYLLALQVVALVLSWWGGSEKWWTLRAVSLSGTAIWSAVLLAHAKPWDATFWFTILYVVLYHAEVIVSALRARDRSEAGRGAAFSVAVTGMLTAAILWTLRTDVPATRGIAMVIIAAAALAVSMVLRRVHLSLFGLSLGYRVQGGVLLLIAVPVVFSGASVTFGWAGVALALAAVGAINKDRGARATAAIAWILAALNLVAWRVNSEVAAEQILVTIFNQPLQAWLLFAWGLAAVGHVIAALNDDDVEANLLSVVASGMFVVATIFVLPTLLSSAILIGYAWLLIGAQRFTPRLEMLKQSVGVLAVVAGKWVVYDTIVRGVANGWGGTAGWWPLVNPMTIVAAAAAGSLLFLGRRRGAISARLCAAVAAGITLWAGTLEIDRLVSTGAFTAGAVWPAIQLKNFAWTAWWSAGVTTILTIAHARDARAIRTRPLLQTLAAFIVLLGAKYLFFDTLMFRLWRGPAAATVIANLQTFAGAIVFGCLVLVRYLLGEEDGATVARMNRIMRCAIGMAMMMLLAVGSLEIDRAFTRSAVVMANFANPRLAGQVALSIFWSLFAIGAVAAGFRIRVAALRYFGLALFAVTLLKVGVIDLQAASTGYRILSFMGLGALLLGTSVLYGKVSPRLLGDQPAA